MPIGLCHLCGTSGPLSYEHVPPRAAFNDHRVLETDLDTLIGGNLMNQLKRPTGRYNQRGVGRYTLCESCNNKTGRWYAPAYIELARATLPLCRRVLASVSAVLQCSIKPVNILKQILVMFCSASPPQFAQKRPSLVRYLLNPESKEFDADLRVFLALYDVKNSRATRQVGIAGRVDLSTASTHVYSEISFPPFNLVLVLSGGCPDRNLFDISWFHEFEYGQRRDVMLTVRNLAVNSQFPADYRSFDELAAFDDKS